VRQKQARLKNCGQIFSVYAGELCVKMSVHLLEKSTSAFQSSSRYIRALLAMHRFFDGKRSPKDCSFH